MPPLLTGLTGWLQESRFRAWRISCMRLPKSKKSFCITVSDDAMDSSSFRSELVTLVQEA